MASRSSVAAAAGLIVLALAIGTVAAGSWGMTIDPATDIPEDEITVDGEQYSIDHLAVAQPGDSVTVTVSGPSDPEIESIEIRNRDGDPEDREGSVTPGEPVAFAIDPPGSYVAILWVEGEIEAIVPIVINAYDVAVDHAGSASPDDPVDVTATLVALDAMPIDEVQLVVWDDQGEHTQTMTPAGEDTYEAAVELEEGTYEVHVVVRGEETLDGTDRREIIAIGTAPSLTVEAHNEQGVTPAPTPTTTPTPTPTPTPDSIATPTPTGTPVTTPTPDRPIITPVLATPTPTPTPAEPSGLPFVVLALGAVAIVFGWFARRRG